MANNKFTIVHWLPELQKHKCGYCKQLNTNCSYGMWAECMTVECYQDLIDRGWRRSGKYLYKSLMDMTCCPLYTIRCEAMNFKLSKSQKKIVKRLNRFLSGSQESKPEPVEGYDSSDCDVDIHPDEMIMSSDALQKRGIKKVDVSKINMDDLRKTDDGVTSKTPASSAQVTDTKADRKSTEKEIVVMKVGDVIQAGETSRKSSVKAGMGADPSRPPAKKAKLLRLERKRLKLAAKGMEPNVTTTSTSSGHEPKSLEQFIEEGTKMTTDGGGGVHQLQVKLVLTSGAQRQYNTLREEEYPTYRKYQMLIHNDTPDKCSERQFTRFLLDSPLEIVVKRMSAGDVSFVDTAALFAKYQMFVHNEAAHDCDSITFLEFLVDTPLQHWKPSDGPEHGYGSFHQQYWLDGKLIAVGVIDVLPRCVSSVYFFYDPDYRHLTLGTYGSLYEVYLTRQLQHTAPDLKHYYMGFYIHTCPKMRYKARLQPSYLLCPETYVWRPVECCVPKLNTHKYSRLNDDETASDTDKPTCADVDNIFMLLGYRTCVPFRFYKTKVTSVDESDYVLFANLVGKHNLHNMLLIPPTNRF